MPTVTSRSSAPSSGCHVRSRWSSRSWGSRRLTARIIIRTYSAIGRLNTPRALVTTRPRSRAAGVSARSTPDVAEWTQARLRRPGQQPVERVGAEPAAQHDLDVVERAVGEALDRDGHEPRARAPRPGSARGRASGSAPTGSGSGRWPSGAPPGPATRAGAGRVRGRSPSAARRRRRGPGAIQRSGASISPSRGSVSGPSHSRVSAAGPRASAMARTNARPSCTAPS